MKWMIKDLRENSVFRAYLWKCFWLSKWGKDVWMSILSVISLQNILENSDCMKSCIVSQSGLRDTLEWKGERKKIATKQYTSRMKVDELSQASKEILFVLPPSFFFLVFGKQPKNVPVADVWTEGVCMLFIYTLPYGTQYDHHNNQ